MEHHLKIEGSKITLKQSYKKFYLLNKIKVIKIFKYSYPIGILDL